QRAGVLTGLDEVHEQVIEIQRVFAEGLVQRGTRLDVALDIQDQLLHGGLVGAVADNLERLHQRNARREHGRQLAAEYRDVFGLDLAAPGSRALLADSRGRNALPPQLHTQRLLIRGEAAALDAGAALVAAFPCEGNVALHGAD